jgi:hypothetical protein
MLILAGVGAGPKGDYESIATTTVGSGGVSSVTFSSIPATYKHLQVRWMARSSSTGTDRASVALSYNGDTGSNYVAHYLLGDGASAASGNPAGSGAANNYTGGISCITAGLATASIFGVGIIDILDYANTNKYKTSRSLTGQDQNSSNGRVQLVSGLWLSTSAITSITLQVNTEFTSNFTQYSSFALYGIKG